MTSPSTHRSRPACGREPALLRNFGFAFVLGPHAVRGECLDRFVIFGERHLRHLLREFAAHYHTERYHQGLGSQIIMPTPSPSNDNASLGTIGCRSRLGGILNFYRREAA